MDRPFPNYGLSVAAALSAVEELLALNDLRPVKSLSMRTERQTREKRAPGADAAHVVVARQAREEDLECAEMAHGANADLSIFSPGVLQALCLLSTTTDNDP